MAELRPVVGRAFYGQFARLRPAQAAAVAACESGDDVVVLAGTGSGKTEAVVAPLVSRYLDELGKADRPVILYVAPTRALVNDVLRRLEGPFDHLGVRVGARHGERNDLAKSNKPAVVITTPESVDVMLFKSPGLLSDVRAVVVDEAHLLYNTQRGLQLALLIQRLEMVADHSVQVAAMSATVADAAALWRFFRPGRAPRIVRDPGSRPIARTIRLGWTTRRLAEALAGIRRDRPEGVKALVFAESRAECDSVAAELRQASGFGESVFAHHSSLSREEREFTESRFQELRSAVCVATTTLELGIDIGNIDVVVLWGRASGWESFLQRIGRGNRRSNEVQVICVVPEDFSTLVPAALGYQALLAQIEAGRLEAASPLQLYGAACQQIMSIVLAADGGFVRRHELAAVFAPWPHLNPSTVELVIDELVHRDLLQRHPVKTSWVGPTQEAYDLVDRMEVWSNFPLSAREINAFHGGHQIGRIPGQNLVRLDVGKTFAFAGRRFQVERIRGDRIDVRPTTNPVQVSLLYDGSGVSLDPSLAEAEWELLASGQIDRDVGSPERIAALESALGGLLGLSPDIVPMWRNAFDVVHLTCAGRRLNQLIAVWAGGNRAKATELTVTLPAELDLASIPTTVGGFGGHLSDVAAGDVSDRTIFQNLLPVDLLRAEALDAWIKTPVYGRTLARLARSDLLEVSAPAGVDWTPTRSRGRAAPRAPDPTERRA